jgi:hypothetical protein
MSRKFLVSIDLNKNELQNGVIQNLATAPGSPVAGQIYYDTVDNELYFYNGSSWESTQANAQVTYGILAARPAAGEAGRLYYATDNYLLYFDDGSTWTQINNFGSVTAQTTYGASSGNGTSTNFARADHTHGTPPLTNEAPTAVSITGTAAVGTGTAPAREDHTHAGPGFGNVTSQTSFAASSNNGSSSNVARADHTHGTPTHDNAAHSAINLSALTVPTADVSFATYKITNLGTPTADTDAATKAYVDATAQGLSIKEAVHLATAAVLPNTPNWTSTNGGRYTATTYGQISIDGQAATVGQRLLVKNQVDSQYNGIYEVTTQGDGGTYWVITRTADANTSAEVKSGMFTFVQTGDTLANTGWVLTTDNPITLNTTGLTFTQFSGAGTYTASNGVALGVVGGANNFSAVAGSGITVNSGGINIDTSVVVRKYAANVGDGTATSYTITHNLGTRDVTVVVYDNSSPYAEVICDVQHTSTTAITLLFSVAPTTNQYRVAVQG